MPKLSLALAILIAPAAGVAAADQSSGAYRDAQPTPTPGQLLNRDYLTSTGATVPRPGLSQSGGETRLDRSIMRQDDKTDNSICKDC